VSALSSFAREIAAAAYRDLGAAEAEAARMRVFDTLCSTAVGLAIPDGQALRRLAEGAGGPEPSLADRIRLYVGATRSTETDDISIACCVTAGSVVVPVAASMAAREPVDDAAFLTAVAAGYEAAIRLGVALDGASLIYKGQWPTYLVAPFAAAAVAARLFRLDARETANALSLALARTPRWMGRSFDGISPRWALLGAAAAEGVAAAQAAAAGLGGDPDLLPSFAEAMGATLDEAALASGQPFGAALLALDAKTFPTSRQGLAATQAFLAHTPLPRPAADIERIEIGVPAQYLRMVGGVSQPANRIESLLSVAYQMALAALHPEGLFDCGRETLRQGPEIADFMARVAVTEDPQLTAAYPGEWGGRVRIAWRSGETQSLTIHDPEGSAARPLGWAALAGKMRNLMPASGLRYGLVQPLQDHCQALARQPRVSVAAKLVGDVERLSSQRQSSKAAV
jgi:2-methylcitrate dehydratase PrpD